jgi:hypothetical protein
VAEQTDLCIAYGEPTTAIIEFISRGSHLLHSSEQTWPSDYWIAPAFVADGTVCSRTDAATLAEVAALLADDRLFRERAQAQQQRYVQRLARADEALFVPAEAAASFAASSAASPAVSTAVATPAVCA